MAFPGSKVHRPSRRKLGAGQYPTLQNVNCTVTGSASTAVLTFDRPVNVKATIGLSVATLTLTTQTVVSATVVHMLMNGALTGHAWSLPSGDPAISTPQGGQVLGSSGTF